MTRKVCGEKIQQVVEQIEQDLIKLHSEETTVNGYEALLSHSIDKLQAIAEDLGFAYF